MRALVGFLGHRLFRALVALWLVSTVVFVVMRLSRRPGAAAAAARRAAQRDTCECAASWASTGRCPVQYAIFLGNILRGDFGRSIHFREPALASGDGLPAGHRSSWG